MPFAKDYFSARARFRRNAALAGWRLQSYAQTARGPNNEELTVDVATIGNAQAPNVLLVSSGLHGVEGYLGSAIQCSTIETSPTWIPNDEKVRVVFVHALNPFAFAWGWRCDRNNVDPNRNFLLPHEEYAGSHATYRKLRRWLNPRRALQWWDPLHLRAAWEMWRLGIPHVKEAIAGGQFDFPDGLFYGGKEPSDVALFLQSHLGDWIQNAKRVLHLDIHTGLGRWSSCKLLIDEYLTQDQIAWLVDNFGEELLQFCDTKGVAYHSRGAFGSWCQHGKPDLEYTYLCAEFGTYSLLPMLLGLRAENQTFLSPNRLSPKAIKARRRLVRLFCPDSRRWRRRTLHRGISLVHIAARALSQWNPATENSEPTLAHELRD